MPACRPGEVGSTMGIMIFFVGGPVWGLKVCFPLTRKSRGALQGSFLNGKVTSKYAGGFIYVEEKKSSPVNLCA